MNTGKYIEKVKLSSIYGGFGHYMDKKTTVFKSASNNKLYGYNSNQMIMDECSMLTVGAPILNRLINKNMRTYSLPEFDPLISCHSIWLPRTIQWMHDIMYNKIPIYNCTPENFMIIWDSMQKYPRIYIKHEVNINGKLKYFTTDYKRVHREAFWVSK